MTRRTKIVATLGPSSASPQVLRRMVEAGMDVARINLAHGDQASHARLIRSVRVAAEACDRPVAVLTDLPGPKLRTAPFPTGGVFLDEGRRIDLVAGDGQSTDHEIRIDHDALPRLHEEDIVTLGDGAVVLSVERAAASTATATVVRGGRVQGRPGVHLPAHRLRLTSPTEADLELLAECSAIGVDMVAVSLVRSADDILRVARAAGPDPPMVVAKIETVPAVEALESILAVADGVMVARGDLGIRLPLEDVPHVQKRVIRTCIAAGRPAITATQMLESMITATTPTRAEVSDVANAVFDGTDAVMLSAETAVGVDPVNVIETMARVVERAEREADYLQWGAKLGKLQRRSELPAPIRITDAVSHAAWTAAVSLDAAALICCTLSGATARAAARFRPIAPLIAVSPSPRTVRQLSLTWGMQAVLGQEYATTDEIVWHAVEDAFRLGLVAMGDVVVVLAGFPEDPEPTTDVLRVVRVR